MLADGLCLLQLQDFVLSAGGQNPKVWVPFTVLESIRMDL